MVKLSLCVTLSMLLSLSRIQKISILIHVVAINKLPSNILLMGQHWLVLLLLLWMPCSVFQFCVFGYKNLVCLMMEMKRFVCLFVLLLAMIIPHQIVTSIASCVSNHHRSNDNKWPARMKLLSLNFIWHRISKLFLLHPCNRDMHIHLTFAMMDKHDAHSQQLPIAL